LQESLDGSRDGRRYVHLTAADVVEPGQSAGDRKRLSVR
jgi:hypothetical protein